MKTNRRFWSTEEIEILQSTYPSSLTEDVAKALNRSVSSVYGMAYLLNIKKSEEFLISDASGRKNVLAESGKAHRFPKGHVPMNKGKKQSDYMTKEQIAKTAKTRFKKGNRPHNYKPVGSRRITRDGYIEVKVKDPNKWKLLHRIVWEQHNGKIPSGMNVQFIDGNRKNCSIENLYLISRADQLRNENSFHARYPESIKKLLTLKRVLTRSINKIQKAQSESS
jgi:hypothetical protein